MAHLPHQAALGPCRPVYIRPGPAFRRPCPADEAVVIAAGEGSREGQGQPCVRVCCHHTPPSRPHASCCFCSSENHVEPACAQSMRETLCPPSLPLPHAPTRPFRFRLIGESITLPAPARVVDLRVSCASTTLLLRNICISSTLLTTINILIKQIHLRNQLTFAQR
jgi:hypothetical protein